MAWPSHIPLCKKTAYWFNEHNAPFVPKHMNPPNVPKTGLIEELICCCFLSVLGDMACKQGWAATNVKQLANRIKIRLKKIDMKVVRTMMEDLCSKLRKIEEQGHFPML